MIYITGDIHADQRKWVELIEPVLNDGDIILVCGDFGIGFWNGLYWSEETFFDHIAKQNYTVLFIDGNHENFNKLNSYSIDECYNGKVHKIRRNLIHLIRGEVYCIEGSQFFTFGGGYSIDKYRRQEGVSWWPQEMPSDEEYLNADVNLKRIGDRIDYIVTHTAPSESVYYLSTMRNFGIKDDVIEERSLTTFLDGIQQRVAYKHWYFGHFHLDKELWKNQTVLFNCVRELETGRIVKTWQMDGSL